MKVVVTGGSGIVGQYVVKDLVAHDLHVVNFDRKKPSEWISRFMLVDASHPAEVYDALAQIRPDAVVHLAANPSPYGHPRHQLFAGNVLSTFHVMQAAADLGIKKIVYASSEMASGWSSANRSPLRVPFTEEDRTPPPNSYALSKFVGEVIADSIVASHPDIQISSLRINWVISPNDHERLRERQHHFPAGHATLWSYIDVRDVASAVRLSLFGDIPGHRVYMIAADDTSLNMPTREAVAKHFGDGVTVDPSLPEYGSCVDCSRIKQDLGWQPEHSWREIPADLLV